MDLRSDVQQQTEQVILEVNDFSIKIIEQIAEYEKKELIEFNKTSSQSFDAFYEIVNELESFQTVNTEYLNKNEYHNKILIKSNEEAIHLIKKAEFGKEKILFLKARYLSFLKIKK